MTPHRGRAGMRVLVVDDDDSVRHVVTRGLLEEGFIVSDACDAAAAMAHLEACDGECDVMVTDLVMPGKSGAQLGLEACERWPHIRVVYMTGYARDELAKHGVTECPHAVLQKPFAMHVLCNEVRALLAA